MFQIQILHLPVSLSPLSSFSLQLSLKESSSSRLYLTIKCFPIILQKQSLPSEVLLSLSMEAFLSFSSREGSKLSLDFVHFASDLFLIVKAFHLCYL